MTQTDITAEMNQIRNTPPSRLIVMLYDGVIAALDAAIEAIEDGDIAKRCRCTNVAIEVVSYLYMSLDMEKGGAIADNLAKLYRFVIIELGKVNRDNDPNVARGIIAVLQPLYDSWLELDTAMNEPLVLPPARQAETRRRVAAGA